MGTITSRDMVICERRPASRPLRAEAPSVPRTVRLSPAEITRLKLAAAINHQTVSEFARDALVTAAEDCIEDQLDGR